jgi:hypothetical protein
MSYDPATSKRLPTAEENAAICDAAPLWEQILYSVYRGKFPVEPLKVPSDPPSNICADCIRKAIFYWAAAKASRLHQRRMVECCHTRADGSRFNCAFIVKGKPPTWIELSEIEPGDLNELYFDLCNTNAQQFTEAAAWASAAVESQAIAVAQVLRQRQNSALAVTLLAVAATLNNRGSQS